MRIKKIMIFLPFLTLFILLTLPGTVHAYLDPGSGNAISYALISGLAAIAYSVRGLYYRTIALLTGKKPFEEKNPLENFLEKDVIRLAIFSEGKAYWSTHKPILDALINKKVYFCYFSADIHDPALQIENMYMQAKYIGNGTLGHRKINTLKAQVLLTTTPNIGCTDYPLQRSPSVKSMIHIFHSIADISVYSKGSLDHFDTVFTAGDFQHTSIREIETKRGIPKKQLINTGVPYLDTLKNEIDNYPSQDCQKNNKPTVLIGSSWGSKGCLRLYGSDFIIPILQAGYRVIIRPHPHSLKHEPYFISQLQSELAPYPDADWDFTVSPTRSMILSDIMVSDTSSIRFDYAFLLEKPVISLEIEQDKLTGFEAEDLDDTWINTLNNQIGHSLKSDEINLLSKKISQTLENHQPKNIAQTRNITIEHFGHSGDVTAEQFVQQAFQQNKS